MTPAGEAPVVHQLLDPGFLSEQLANLQAQHRNILSAQDYQDMEADLQQRRARAVSAIV